MRTNRLRERGFMSDRVNMAEFLCTRLCHDLTGPIGAVNNGAEFLSEEGFDLQKQAVDLIVSSAASAVSRLQFYRVAYGNVKNHGEANLAEKQKIAADFFVGSKISLDWPEAHTDASGVSISLKMLRLIYNLLIISSNSLMRGGTISVRLEKDNLGQKIVIVSAKGDSIKWDTMAEKILSLASPYDIPPDCALSAKNVQLHITKQYTVDLNATIKWTVTAGELVLKVTQPLGEQQTIDCENIL